MRLVWAASLFFASNAALAQVCWVEPPNAGGQADIVYHGGKDFAESKESLQALCEAFEGKWVQSGK